MSKSACYPQSCHELATQHLIYAMKHARAGHEKNTQDNLDLSHSYAQMHSKRLESMGRHEEAKQYLNEHEKHVKVSNDVLSRHVKKTEGDACKCSKQELDKGPCNCAQMHKTAEPELEKAFQFPWKEASPARKEFNATGKVARTMEVKKPGMDPRYHYKPVHELHPEDQVSAQKKFGSHEIGHYVYPIDKETGRLAHAARAPSANIETMRAGAAGHQELRAEHKEGATVRIHAPGTKMHDAFGIVHGESPYHPGKIAVSIKNRQKVFVEPHQVKLNKPTTKIEKAMMTLYNIEKVLRKV